MGLQVPSSYTGVNLTLRIALAHIPSAYKKSMRDQISMSL